MDDMKELEYRTIVLKATETYKGKKLEPSEVSILLLENEKREYGAATIAKAALRVMEDMDRQVAEVKRKEERYRIDKKLTEYMMQFSSFHSSYKKPEEARKAIPPAAIWYRVTCVDGDGVELGMSCAYIVSGAEIHNHLRSRHTHSMKYGLRFDTVRITVDPA